MRLPILKWIFLFHCLFAVCGCDFIYGLLQKEGAEEKELLGNVDPLEENQKVKEIQFLLKLHGYRIGTPDGKMGPNTRKAIEDFQTDYQLPAHRFVDNATWKALNRFSESGLIVDGAIDTTALQRALKSAGVYGGVIDGKYGPKTQQAVRDFQRKHSLKPDGIIGIKTITKLAEYLPAQEETF